MSKPDYVHGYSELEAERLFDQANTLAELLHHDTRFPAGHTVLEAGCGVGAQTAIVAGKNTGVKFVSVDVSEPSLETNRKQLAAKGINNVDLRQADIFNLPFPERSFDHVFVCFVLEHLAEPVKALEKLKRVLKPGGSITVIEGDHGSSLFSPFSNKAWATVQCLIDVQKRLGGDSLIGRTLFPLLRRAGFEKVAVSPRFVYADDSRPEWVEGFTRRTYIAMVKGVREQALEMNLISETDWDEGIRDLERTAGPDGVFCYTFFKATAHQAGVLSPEKEETHA
ncbi:MAG: methyltransferase domain-containing protein [candidate division FCPU426 bacterium]